MRAVLLKDSIEALFDVRDTELYALHEKHTACLSKEKTRTLAEAVILQAIEDLWEPAHREESLEFFMGEGFETCSSMAGMNCAKKIMLLKMIAESAPKQTVSQTK